MNSSISTGRDCRLGIYTFLMLFMVCSLPGYAAVIRVPGDQPDIQSGINAAVQGDTVLIADGTYRGAGNLNIDFFGKAIRVMSENGPEYCVVNCESSGRGFLFQGSENYQSVLDGVTIRECWLSGSDDGAGIRISGASPMIINCHFEDNTTQDNGGGIYIRGNSRATIFGCVFSNNFAEDGGAIYIYDSNPRIENCLMVNNHATQRGGGIYLSSNSYTYNIMSCTLVANTALASGGGIFVYTDYDTIVENCIIWDNSPNAVFDQYGTVSVRYSDIQGGFPGEGNIDEDPMFEIGQLGNFYMSQQDAGQTMDSPCMNAGSELAYLECFTIHAGEVCLSDLTTRTDEVTDGWWCDMGYHYPAPEVQPTPTPDITILRVPDDYATIQAAIDAAEFGDTVLISDGTYTGSGNKNLDTLGKPIVVKSVNGSEACVIDCRNWGRGFIFQNGEREDTQIRGLTIRNANAREEDFGGGILCINNSSPEISFCHLQNNTAQTGGGIAAIGSSPEIIFCDIDENSADWDGGGIYLSASYSEIKNCKIYRNTAVGFNGGGLCVRNGSGVVIDECQVTENRSSQGGGLAFEGAYNCELNNSTIEGNTAFYGGGIYLVSTELDMTGLRIESNTADFGAGIYTGPRDVSNIENCWITDNAARRDGGGIFLSHGNTTRLVLSVWDGNSAEQGGAVYWAPDAIPFVTSNEFSRNMAGLSGGAIHIEFNSFYVQIGDYNGGNEFQDNQAGTGSDVYCASTIYPVYLFLNTFHGNVGSDYYVSPLDRFVDESNISLTTLLSEDVYVSPEGSDDNTGTSEEESFLTINHALGVLETGQAPLNVHVAAGEYSATLTGEQFPLPVLPHVSIFGAGAEETILDAGHDARVFVAANAGNSTLSGMTISNGSGERGAGLYCENSDLFITANRFEHNHARLDGGAVFIGESHEDLLPVIGGWPTDGNTFQANAAGTGRGADLHSDAEYLITATNNFFYSDYTLDFYVYPQTGFDLDFSEAEFSYINQDVYVSPDGDDSNDGLSAGSPFKTIQHALRKVQITSELVVVYLDEGTYSPSATGEVYPLHIPDNVVLIGEGMDTTILDAEEGSGIINCNNADISGVTLLTLTGGWSETGGAVRTQNSWFIIWECMITENTARLGSGVYCSNGDLEIGLSDLSANNSFRSFSAGGAVYGKNSELILSETTVSGNSAAYGGGIFNDLGSVAIAGCRIASNSAAYGGGVYSSPADLEATSCFFTGNTASLNGGGIYMWGGQPSTITNCTFAQNTARFFGGGLTADSARECELVNSVFWGDSGSDGSEIALVSIPQNGPCSVSVEYCDIQGGAGGIFVEVPDELTWGSGNIESDPLFVMGPKGNHYLSQMEAGQVSDSPCLDSGNALASNICYNSLVGTVCMSELTTRTDQVFDTGTVDLGAHYPFQEDPPTPTPTPTPTPIPDLGVNLELSQNFFQAGDEFLLDAFISNPGPETYTSHPFVVVLDVYSYFFWYPSWTVDFSYELLDIDVGTQYLEILRFTWPEVNGHASGLRFYGAILNAEFTEIIGEWDMVEFSY